MKRPLFLPTGLFLIGLLMSAHAQTFTNPVLRNDFADPFILRVGDTFYAYATNVSGRNIQVSRSQDLVNWDIPSEALPGLPRWARLGGSLVWAPEVLALNGRYLLYYTARDKASDRQCIGVAVSDEPDKFFQDTSDAPLVCQAAEGGSIDASPFRDTDGTLYLLWKNDGNCCGLATYIYAQKLAPDGLSLIGEPTRLIRNDQAWEGNLVEAPTLWRHENRYYLFFSANSYAGPEYAVGYAVCDTPLGPCQKAPENPILKSDMTPPLVIGPGHQSLIVDDAGQTWLVYHAWEVTSAGLRGGRRLMWLDKLEWVDGKPKIQGPSTGPQPVPVATPR